MKSQKGTRVTALLFLEPRLLIGVGGLNHAPVALHPGKRPGTLCTTGWVGRRVGMDGCRISRPHQNSILGPSTP